MCKCRWSSYCRICNLYCWYLEWSSSFCWKLGRSNYFLWTSSRLGWEMRLIFTVCFSKLGFLTWLDILSTLETKAKYFFDQIIFLTKIIFWKPYCLILNLDDIRNHRKFTFTKKSSKNGLEKIGLENASFSKAKLYKNLDWKSGIKAPASAVIDMTHLQKFPPIISRLHSELGLSEPMFKIVHFH